MLGHGQAQITKLLAFVSFSKVQISNHNTGVALVTFSQGECVAHSYWQLKMGSSDSHHPIWKAIALYPVVYHHRVVYLNHIDTELVC